MALRGWVELAGDVPRDTLRARVFSLVGWSERKEVSVAEMAKYRGGCHCGGVRNEVDRARTGQVVLQLLDLQETRRLLLTLACRQRTVHPAVGRERSDRTISSTREDRASYICMFCEPVRRRLFRPGSETRRSRSDDCGQCSLPRRRRSRRSARWPCTARAYNAEASGALVLFSGGRI